MVCTFRSPVSVTGLSGSTAVVSGRLTVSRTCLDAESFRNTDRNSAGETASSAGNRSANHDQGQYEGHDLWGIVLSCLLAVFLQKQNTKIAGLLFLSSSQTHPGLRRILRITCGITRIMLCPAQPTKAADPAGISFILATDTNKNAYFRSVLHMLLNQIGGSQ